MIRLKCVSDGYDFYRALAYGAMHECTGMLCSPGVPEGVEDTPVTAALNALTMWVRYIIVNRLHGADIDADSPIGRDGRSFAWVLQAACNFMTSHRLKQVETPNSIMRALHPCHNTKLKLLRKTHDSSHGRRGIESKFAHKLLFNPLPTYMQCAALHAFCEAVHITIRAKFSAGSELNITPSTGGTRHVLTVIELEAGEWCAEATMRSLAPLFSASKKQSPKAK